MIHDLLNQEFLANDENREIMRSVRAFVNNDVIPNRAHYDETGEFPWPLLKKAFELGFVNTSLSGLTLTQMAHVSEELAFGCMGLNTVIMANDLALFPLHLGASQAQKERFIKPLLNEYSPASFCLTEPDVGSDAQSLKTKLTPLKDGDFVLNGEKMWITNAGFAHLYVVYATIDPQLRSKGIACVVVEKNAPGLQIGKAEKKMGHRCSDTRSVTFTDCLIKKEQVIAAPGLGWKLAMKTLDHSRPLVAASALGGARSALHYALEYSQSRTQFGVRIGEHEMIQDKLSQIATHWASAHGLVYQATKLNDQKKENTLLASMAKYWASEVCMNAALEAVQIHGGNGYSQEYPVEKIMRDAKLLQIYEGTTQIQKIIIAKNLLA